MREFHGDLLIGGMALRNVRGQLTKDEPAPGSDDRQLCGCLRIDPQHQHHVQPGRVYRLLLDDGRAGQIVVGRIAAGQDVCVAEFAARPAAVGHAAAVV